MGKAKRLLLGTALALGLFGQAQAQISNPGITQLNGDVTAAGTGNVPASVVRLQGRAFANTAPSDTNVICWDTAGSTWKPCTGAAGTTWELTDGIHDLTAISKLTVGPGLVAGGTNPNGTLDLSAPNRSSASAITFTSADFTGQVNSTGTTNTATIPANTVLGANQSILLTNQGSGVVTNTDSQTVNGLALPTKLHSFGFYAYTGNSTSVDAFGFPGFDTITTNALAKFSDGSGATTASSITDNGTTVITSENLTVSGGAIIAGVNTSTAGTVKMFGSSSGDATIGVAAAAGSSHTILLPAAKGTNGDFLKTDGGTPEQLSWGTVSATGCVVSGTQFQILAVDVTGALCVADASALVNAGALTLGTNTSVAGTIKLFGSTSGDDTISTAAVAGTATKFQLPADNGSNTNVLQTDGSGVLSWAAKASGCAPSGTNHALLTDDGFGGCRTEGFAAVANGDMELGASGTEASILFGNDTSGGVTLKTVQGVALGSVVASLPANTGTIAELNLAQAWTAGQTFGEVHGNAITDATSTRTLSAADCGGTIIFTDNAAVTVTIPATLPVKCSIAMEQQGYATAAGLSITGSAVTPATLHKAFTNGTTRVQYSVIGITVESNSGGSSAVAVMWGDGA